MPKNYGLKDKDRVITYVIDQLLGGKLRTDDRLDRNEIARELGLSRLPVSEAISQLEHDGVLSTRYHRGAFVERFEPSTVFEHHEVYGLLSGMASARAATHPTPRVIASLNKSMEVMRNTSDSTIFQEAVSEYRRTINHEYAGPRLQAAIRASQNFVFHSFWVSYLDNQTRMLPFYEDEHSAIRRRDPNGARVACAERAVETGRIVVAELVRRGVFDDIDDVIQPELSDIVSQPERA